MLLYPVFRYLYLYLYIFRYLYLYLMLQYPVFILLLSLCYFDWSFIKRKSKCFTNLVGGQSIKWLIFCIVLFKGYFPYQGRGISHEKVRKLFLKKYGTKFISYTLFSLIFRVFFFFLNSLINFFLMLTVKKPHNCLTHEVCFKLCKVFFTSKMGF